MADIDDIARKKQAAEEERKRKQRVKAHEKHAEKAIEEARKADESVIQQALSTAHSQINAAEARAQRALNEKLKGADALEGINRILTMPGIRTTKSLSKEHAQKVTSRPQGKDGAVSFHFSVTSVTKGGELASVLRDRKSVAAALSSAKPHQKYIERNDAAEKIEVAREVADVSDPNKVEILRDTIVSSFGNISDDPGERDLFWQLVDENEETPSDPLVIFDPKVDPALLSKVQVLASLAGETYGGLDAAVATQQPTQAQISSKDALALTHLLQKAGHQPIEFDPDNTDCRAPVAFKLGAGGRTQIRLVVELPHEMTPIQRLELAKDFTSRYEEDNLKYWAVIHAPDKHNDDRNFHLHINLYDRPCERVFHEPSNAMRWDFERVSKYYPSNRMTRIVRITERKKLADCRAQGWVRSERQRFATIANAHLDKAGIPKRLDARRYEEMGVQEKARTRVPPAAYARERKGEPTAVGVAFAKDQWEINRKAVEVIAQSDHSYEAWRRAWLRNETRPQIGRGTRDAVLAIQAATKVATLSAEKTKLVTERNALNHIAAKIESRARLKPENRRDEADNAALAVANEIKADIVMTDRKIGLTLMKIARAEHAYLSAKKRDDQDIVAGQKGAIIERMRAMVRNAIREVDGETRGIGQTPKAPVVEAEKAPLPQTEKDQIIQELLDEADRRKRADQIAEIMRRQVQDQREERERAATSLPPDIIIPKPAPASIEPAPLQTDGPEGTPIAANPQRPQRIVGRNVTVTPVTPPGLLETITVSKPTAETAKTGKPEQLEKEGLLRDGLSKENLAKFNAIRERIRRTKGLSR